MPANLVKEEVVKKHYERDLFVEKVCEKCPVFKADLRPGELVTNTGKVFACYTNCPWGGYTGHYKSYSKLKIKGYDYYSVPVGNLRAVRKNLGISLKNALDIRCNKKTRYPLTFTGKLFTGKELRNGQPSPDQVKVVQDFMASKGQTGVIKAKARSGKTTVSIYIVCELAKPTIIMVHEKLLLNQFYKTFVRFTDIKRQERRAGKKLLVIAKTEKDLKLDVPYLLVNYQKFISDLGAKRVAQYLAKRYSIVVCDEVHRSSSDKYNALLNRLDPRHRIGLTATDNRKDGKYILTIETLGPVVAEGNSATMIPAVYIKETTYKPKRQWRGRMAYGNATRWLAGLKERNIEVVKQVFADLRKNDMHSIVIPVINVSHARKLTRMINKQAVYNNLNKGEKWSPNLALMLWGGVKNKDALLDKARSRKSRVVVSITKFIKDGIDVEPWTHMYVLFAGSNVENSLQMTARILTPYEGKPRPIIRLWLDPVDVLRSCVRNTYRDSYIPLGYMFGKKTKTVLEDLCNERRVQSGNKWIKTKIDTNSKWVQPKSMGW